MPQRRKYASAPAMRQICAFLEISEARVLARMGLSPDTDRSQGVDALAFFNGWRAIEAEAGIPDLALRLALYAAMGPTTPALFAFSCSPDVQTGLRRLSVFKPLVAPIALSVDAHPEGVCLRVGSREPDAEMPASMQAFELIFLTECIRNFTGHRVIPQNVTLPAEAVTTPDLPEYFGIGLGTHGPAQAVFHSEDATRPLVSADNDFWQIIEKELTGRLQRLEADDTMVARVRSVLIDTLPSGHVSVETVCSRLGVSRRSLQRALQAEGDTFQGVLNTTRAELAQTYLARGDISTEEISHLLAYRDPNSFYRAFHAWTGLTPAQARSAARSPQASA